MLLEDEPSHPGKDGSTYKLDRKELLILAQLLDEEERSRLKIHILIMTDTSYGDGYWKMMGKIEVKALSKLIDREPEREDKMRIFYPYFRDIRVKLPTATNAVFSY